MKKLTTAKSITYIVLIFYIISYFLNEFIQIKYNKDLSSNMSYILPVVMIIIPSYFGSKTYENYRKGISGDFTIGNCNNNNIETQNTEQQIPQDEENKSL